MIIWQKVSPLNGLLYMTAQFLGGILGAACLYGSVKVDDDSNPIDRVVNKVSANSENGPAFLMEMVLSFLLVYVVAETAVSSKSQAGVNAPLAIGLAVFLAHAVSIPFTGTSINPARSLGPAIVANDYEDLWIFFIAPITGSVLAALLTQFGFRVLDA